MNVADWFMLVMGVVGAGYTGYGIRCAWKGRSR
jgi:hypothetical protein